MKNVRNAVLSKLSKTALGRMENKISNAVHVEGCLLNIHHRIIEYQSQL